ncbi:chemotaxis protein CheB [Belnapia sp. T6]|uniref:protein-glutamate methylesterase n=1 Tax=Belnapia mucosa TaxID=2804532 RepID=A0ABS1V9X2_9PROT|nr:chemotaxis protein CheB [Belnapia mucosa]MBL6458458.1 chemotaxis protein CheB [Belnapia mucosa]
MADTEGRDIIVIGASAGGTEALQRLLGALPADLPASLFVTVHIGARRSMLDRVLAKAGPLPVAWAEDGAPIRPGEVRLAPPDHHLLLEPGRMRLFRGPRENMTRPAVDPLFRSAARSFGGRVVAVVLSGNLADGTAGMAEVKRHGGIGIVQDPAEAEFRGMPESALRHTKVDHSLPVLGIAALLRQLAGPGGSESKEEPVSGGYQLGPPVALTCPTCGGSLREERQDSLPYFSCHIGHRFAAADMDEAQFQQMEGALEVALRALNERTALCERLAESARLRGAQHSVERWEAAEREARSRAETLRHFIERGWQRPDPDERSAPDEEPA